MARGSAAGADAGWTKPQVRAKVLQAAMEVIAEVGPGRVTVKDVADRAGMSTGHVLYYFGRRERILVNALLLGEADLAGERDRRLAQIPAGWQAIEALAGIYLPTGPDDVRWKLWAQLIAQPPADEETLRQFAEVIDSWSLALEEIVRAGVTNGTFREVDAAEVGYRYCRMMDGLAIEILLACPGRTREWALRTVGTALRRELAAPG